MLAWTVSVGMLGTGVVLSFEGLVSGLTRAPSPSAQQAAVLIPPGTRPDEVALGQAQRLMGQGDLSGALRVLDTISPEDPSYPLSQELRAQAERGLSRMEGTP